MKSAHAKRKATVAAQLAATTPTAAQTKQNRFLGVFVMFIVFISVTIIIYQRTATPELIYTATHMLDGTSAGNLLNAGASHFPVLNNMLHHGEGDNVTIAAGIQTTPDDGGIKLIQKVEALKLRTEEILFLITDTSIAETKPFIRWDLISNSEVHLLHKLSKFLKGAIAEAAQSSDSQEDFISLIQHGYQCTALQAKQQELISRYISMDICSEVEWYKVVQLAWPEAKEFIDVGANKGYLGSLFVSLWGGGGFGLSPSDVFAISTAKKLWKDSRNPAGYCKDGYNQASALYCPAPNKRDWKTARCQMANDGIRVTSLDGSSYLAETLNRVMRQEVPATIANAALREGKVWRYLNYAVSNVNGVATFTKQTAEANAGFEGGHIHDAAPATTTAATRARRLGYLRSTPDADADYFTSSKSDLLNENYVESESTMTTTSISNRRLAAQTEQVPMTTIDSFLAANGITELDILKIDTEGNDNKVLDGAKEAINNKAGMFTFEGGNGVTLSKEMLVEFDAQGFSCYSTSRAGLFKWSGGCMPEKFMGGFRAKDKGNIFCINRFRAPAASLAYDILSFPMLVEDFINSATAVASGTAGAMGAAAGANSIATAMRLLNESLVEEIAPGDLTPIYLNIKPFCAPWPTCAKV